MIKLTEFITIVSSEEMRAMEVAEAEARVLESIDTIRFYMSEGIDKDKAIEMARGECALGKGYWQKVLEAIQ